MNNCIRVLFCAAALTVIVACVPDYNPYVTVSPIATPAVHDVVGFSPGQTETELPDINDPLEVFKFLAMGGIWVLMSWIGDRVPGFNGLRKEIKVTFGIAITIVSIAVVEFVPLEWWDVVSRYWIAFSGAALWYFGQKLRSLRNVNNVYKSMKYHE